MSLEPGDIAPDFTLPGSTGETLSLSSLRGRSVVLYFYPKDDTSGCTKEAIAFNGMRDAFAAANTAIIGVSADSMKSHEAFRDKYDLAIPLASDEKKEAIEAYGVWVEKSMYGRKYFGIDRATFLINPEGKIAQVWRKVKVPGHAEAVLKEAQAL
ncbi:peroxiredoxin [Pseudochelatococcus sp. G4_1912]|uniref:peroxiredoxin n=1 Tax=Pseudochelatococcus sp. G4_1912 TaxID=3114288 RepID=UPI0039C726E6